MTDEQLASIRRVMERHAGDFDRLADYDRGSLTVPDEKSATQQVDFAAVESIVAVLRDRYPDDLIEFVLWNGEGGDASPGSDGRVDRIEQDIADDHRQLDAPVEAEIAECARVNAPGTLLESIENSDGALLHSLPASR